MKDHIKKMAILALVALLIASLSLSGGMALANSIVVVTEDNVGVDWFENDTRFDGYVAFVEGPGTPPLGIGSLEMGTTAEQDKAQLFNYDHMGTALAAINALGYATYRHSSSTNSPAQYPAINIEVDYVGDDSSYTTLVWEPIYAYGQSNLAVDMWQTWDTMAPSQTSFGGGWWSTKDIPGVCAFNCFVDWGTIVQNNSNAKIRYGFGVNVGSGWVGTFTGAVDALTLSVDGDAITYDFEPLVEIEVGIDIKPGSCPNPLNVKSKGVLPIAILGTSDFDVTQVDPASAHLEGVSPLRWDLEDVATPFELFTGKEDAHDCNEDGPDGYLDLTLKFRSQEIVEALGEVNDGDVLVLQLTGNLKEEYGGTSIVGEDVVVILKKGKE